eukprot:m.451642 g.451642  ORF g.451642 m.451642 type:complete len:322 (-) comp56920_c0_seq1:2104-3069(-)
MSGTLLVQSPEFALALLIRRLGVILQGGNAVQHAVISGQIESLKALMKAGANPLPATSAGQTLLHLAAKQGQAIMLEWLLHHFPRLSASMTEKDQRDCTPVVYAVKKGSVGCLLALQAAGLDLRAAFGEHLGTALWLAAESGRGAMLSYLLDQQHFREHVNARNSIGLTALMLAIYAGSFECYEVLCAAGADPCVTTEETKETLLHLAVNLVNEECLEFLLKNEKIRAQINALDRSGYSALSIAVMRSSPACTALLLSAGADCSLRNTTGHTAIHHAARCNNKEILHLLLQTGAVDLDLLTHVAFFLFFLDTQFAHATSSV